MNLQQLKYVNEISKQGTINRAAANLFVTAPTVSISLKELESELGFQIFERTSNGMRTTIRGSSFIEYVQKALAQLTALETAFLSNKSPKRKFSISSQHYDFASEAFAQLINESPETHYTYRFLETETKKVITDVANHFSEIGIIYLSEFNTKTLHESIRKNKLSYVSLLKFQPHVFLNPQHPLAIKPTLTYSDLQNYPAVTFEQTTDSTIHYSEEPLELQNQAKIVNVSDRASAINVLIGSNSYLVGSGIMSSKLTSQSLISIPLQSIISHEIIYLLREDVPPSSTAVVFIEKLKQVIEKKIQQAEF